MYGVQAKKALALLSEKSGVNHPKQRTEQQLSL